MVKVKDFCCGCGTLRCGTASLAWGVLIGNILFLLERLIVLSASEISVICILTVTEEIIAIAISLVAIWAVQKVSPRLEKRAKYLNGLFWYFGYTAIVYAIHAILTIFNSPFVEDSIEYAARKLSIDIESSKVLMPLLDLSILAIALYFALVVKSHRDCVLKNEIQRDDFEAQKFLTRRTAVA